MGKSTHLNGQGFVIPRRGSAVICASYGGRDGGSANPIAPLRPSCSRAGHMKYWSQTFLPTLKESPADAELASHKLLLRAGLVRKLGGGLYTFMPAGLKVMQKISQICRE